MDSTKNLSGLSELSLSELSAVDGGLGVTRPMEEGVIIDGVRVYTYALTLTNLLKHGPVATVTVKGL